MGVGDSWGTREELLHPRDKNGRFRSTWKMAAGVVDKILSTLSSFNPKTFTSDEEAASYVQGQARSNRFLTNRGTAIDRFLRGYSTVNADLRAGKPNADAAAIEKGMAPLPDDLILSRVVGPEAFGLNPQSIGNVEELTGKLISDKGFSSTNLGTPMPHQPGQITMSIVAPKGTKALMPSTSRPTREVILGTNQPYRITKVDPDGQGGFYVYAVAQGDSNAEKPVDIGSAVPGDGVEAAPPEAPAAAPAAPGAPAPVQAPGAPAAPTAAPVRTGRPGRPAGPPPAPRNEGHVGTVGTGQAPAAPQGGVPERAPEPVPPLPEAPEPGPDSRSTFREAFEQAGLKVPSVGTRRKEFNDAYLGVASGKKTPQEAVRDLDDRIAIHKATIASDKEDGTDSGPLPEDVRRLEGLSDLIKEHYNFTGRKTAKAAPEKKVAAKKAPAKTLREEVSLNATEKRLQKENGAAAAKVDNSDLDGKDAAQLRAIADKEDIPTRGMGDDPEKIAQTIRDIRFKRTQPASGFGAPPAKKAATPLKAARKAAAPRPKLEERKDELSGKSADELRAIAAKEDIPTRNLGNNPEEIAQTIRDIRFKRDRNATPFKEAGKEEAPTPVARKAAQRKESRDRLAGGAEERQKKVQEDRRRGAAAAEARADREQKELLDEYKRIAAQVDGDVPDSELVRARIGISDSGFKSKRVSAADTAAGLRETAEKDYVNKKDRDLLLKLADFYESKGRPRKAAPAKKAEPAAGDVDNMTVPQLRAEAARQGKKIPSSITKKADIQAFLKGDKEAPLSVAETKTIATGNNGNSVIGSRRTLDSLEAKGLIEFRDAGRPSGRPAPFLTEKGRKAAGFEEKAPEPKKVTPPAKKAVPAEVVKDAASHDEAITPKKAAPPADFKPITNATGGDAAKQHVPAGASGTAFDWAGHQQPKWGLKQENDYGDGIDYYQKDGFIPVNDFLRGKGESNKRIANAIRGIDGTMRASKTTGPIETWRGSSSTKKLFGDKTSGDLAGMEWDEDAYVSTSTKEGVARNFAFNPNAEEGDAPLVMKIVTPKGVGALKMGSASHGTDEGEILLQRGLKMRVTKDLGLNKYGERVIEVQATPKTVSKAVPSVPEAPTPAKTAETAAPDIDKMTIPQLREEAKRQGKRVPTGITKKADIQAFLRDDTENRKQSQAIREGVKATPADVKATAARSAAADARASAPTPARKPEWGTLKTHGLKTGDEAMYYGSLRNSPKAQGRRVRIERAKYGGYDLIDVETDKKIADGANATRLWLSPLPRSAPKAEAPKPPAEKGLIYMTVPELREKARTEGIKVPPHRKTKAEIVDWLADSLAAKERGEPLPQEPGQREIRRANVAARKRIKAMEAEDRRKLAEAKAAAPKKVLPTDGAPKSHEEIATNIRSAKTREEAEKVLDDANLSIPELKQLAESMNIATRGNKTQIRKDIVYWGVGRKLDREAVSRPGEVTSRTLQDAMERRGDPALVPVESKKPLLANHWGTLDGEINYHEDGHIGTALNVMGPEAQRYEVPGENGDNLYNVLGRLATQAVRGQITQQQLIEKVKAIQAKMPDSRATRALSTAIRDMETPDLPPIELPDGVPAPITKLARALEKIPLARKDRRGMGRGMNEVDRLADLMADWQQGRMTPLRFMAELRQRLLNNRHESEEGKFDIDRVVQQALQELEALMKVDRKKLLPPEMRK